MVNWLGALISGVTSVIAYRLFVKLDERVGLAKIFNTKLKINNKLRFWIFILIFNFILMMIFYCIVPPSPNNNSIYYYISYGIVFGFILAFGQRILNAITPEEDIVKKSNLNKIDEIENKKEN